MTHSTNILPVISMAGINRNANCRMIDTACREWGFFQVVDHGIDPEVIRNVRTQMRNFFDQCHASKQQLERTEYNPWGYYDKELTKNVRDWKQLYDYGPSFKDKLGQWAEPRWPQAMPAFRAAVEAYYQACKILAPQILKVLAYNLNADADCLLEYFGTGHTSFLRMNYYPLCPPPVAPAGEAEPMDEYLGLNRHTDSGALTLLLQDDQPGLQVFNRGRWHLVEPVTGAITINLGDIVQVWSNDQYKAALHRVLANPNDERYSIPFFYNPRPETNYTPLPGTVSELCPARYRAINWGEFRAQRVAGDYADVGEEVQISHYAVEETSADMELRYGLC
jgi:isopenicillin N synthase-like dioxygenase